MVFWHSHESEPPNRFPMSSGSDESRRLDKESPARCYSRMDGSEPSRGDAMATHPHPHRAYGARA